jgi:hypothetical protein
MNHLQQKTCTYYNKLPPKLTANRKSTRNMKQNKTMFKTGITTTTKQNKKHVFKIKEFGIKLIP